MELARGKEKAEKELHLLKKKEKEERRSYLEKINKVKKERDEFAAENAALQVCDTLGGLISSSWTPQYKWPQNLANPGGVREACGALGSGVGRHDEPNGRIPEPHLESRHHHYGGRRWRTFTSSYVCVHRKNADYHVLTIHCRSAMGTLLRHDHRHAWWWASHLPPAAAPASHPNDSSSSPLGSQVNLRTDHPSSCSCLRMGDTLVKSNGGDRRR